MTTGRINQVAAASERGVQPGAAPQEPPLSVSDKFRGAGWPDGGLTQASLPPPSPAGTRCIHFDPLSHFDRPAPFGGEADLTDWHGRARLRATGGAVSNVIPENTLSTCVCLAWPQATPTRGGGVRLRNRCEVLPAVRPGGCGRHSLPGEVLIRREDAGTAQTQADEPSLWLIRPAGEPTRRVRASARTDTTRGLIGVQSNTPDRTGSADLRTDSLSEVSTDPPLYI